MQYALCALIYFVFTCNVSIFYYKNKLLQYLTLSNLKKIIFYTQLLSCWCNSGN